MFIKRNLLYKRKVIGGSIFGNLFNSAKNMATTATKIALRNAAQRAGNVLKSSNIKNLVKRIAKDQFGVSNLQDAKQLALTQATQKANQLGSDFAQKALSRLSKSQRVPSVMKEAINELASNPQAKKALTKKSKELIRRLSNQAPISDGSRAMISNILAGSGIKKL